MAKSAFARRIEKDLERAAQIQRDFLPRQDPRFDDFDISGRTISCYEVGGDYHDFIPIDEKRLGIAVADVSGKGIAAALLMASLRAALRSEIRPEYDLADMASRLNDFVERSTAKDTFITFFYGELSAKGGIFRYVNAGHHPPLFHQKGGPCCVLEGTGLPLGMLPGTAYAVKSVSLKPGDSILIFTDGAIEGRDKADREFSMYRMATLFQENASAQASELVSRIGDEVKRHISGSTQCDDVTLVVIKKQPDESAGTIGRRSA